MNHATQQQDGDEDPDPRPPSAAERFMRALARNFVLGAATAAGASCVTLLIQSR
ncbi:hypothetical protein ACIBO6_28475 [Streptomyces luteogriseus]|uniref:hypothetical protein n=1 Tax=Streptomyces luteogriseus TaxID=68233 RepID=UPI0037A4FCD9